jgi:hypothetical protein
MGDFDCGFEEVTGRKSRRKLQFRRWGELERGEDAGWKPALQNGGPRMQRRCSVKCVDRRRRVL